LENITKSFSGVTVLYDNNFTLFEGEIHCIVGENGAGKSTLIKLLSGAETPDRGTITVFGNKFSKLNPVESIRLGISTLYQDVDLVDTLTVSDNIFLGEELKKFGFIHRSLQVQKSIEIMQKLNININAQSRVEDLSAAQKQSLQIVKAMHRDAKILIMDEPTASLGEEETKALMLMIKNLANNGIAIIYISHYLEEVFNIADRITVLKDGHTISCRERDKFTAANIVQDMVGREASLFYKRERIPIGEIVLKVENYTRGQTVKNVSFEVRKNEIFGIGGLVGSGRTELAQLIYGVDRKESGRLYFNEDEITPVSPRDAIEKGLCMLGENRKVDSLFLDRNIMENICIVKNEAAVFLNIAKDRSIVAEMIRKINIKTTGFNQEASRLSGGNQQKIIIARWLLANCNILIFDEPTKGVDIGAREEIYKLMIELARQGKVVILITSDMPELLAMSDRIGVMREGSMVEVIDADVTEEELVKKFIGIA
jgi:ribose transport system ATP-binding protein